MRRTPSFCLIHHRWNIVRKTSVKIFLQIYNILCTEAIYPNVSLHCLGHSQVVPIKSIVGDIRNLSDLREAMNGVDMVIHTAGLVSFGTFPQSDLMQEVNVKGIY